MAEPAHDVIILGSGPAGLQAAIHAARKKANVLVLGRPEASGLYAAHIENYCCVPGVTTGPEMIAAGIGQAKGFGAEFINEDAVLTAALDNGAFEITSESRRRFSSYAIIVATGIKRKGLGLKGEKELMGRGISYCVDCDANFYRGATVAVFGDGSAAAHGAVTLGKIASKVFLVAPKGLNISSSLNDELKNDNVNMIFGQKVSELLGEDRLQAVILDNGQRLDIDCLFIETGAKGAMELVATLGVALDPERFTYILTDKNQATNIPGIFAAGDICGLPWQMAKAVGEGCVSGLAAANYALKKRRERRKGDDVDT